MSTEIENYKLQSVLGRGEGDFDTTGKSRHHGRKRVGRSDVKEKTASEETTLS